MSKYSVAERTPILSARHISKLFYDSGKTPLAANQNISLDLYPGETLGIVGESGCGKSTLIRMLARLMEPTSGEILFRGEDISNLKGEALRQSRRHIQMVFQDPATAFHPKMRVQEILTEPLTNYGLIRPKEKEAKARELLRMVDLPEEFVSRLARSMSGGQRQRLGIARALALEPEVLLCDEATSALDVSVQRTVVQLLVKLQRERELAMAFICHDVALVCSLAHRVAVMYLGRLVELGPSTFIEGDLVHPYTALLKSSIFSPNMDFTKPIPLEQGEAGAPADRSGGCPFAGRCPHCTKLCVDKEPELHQVEENHWIACHLYNNI